MHLSVRAITFTDQRLEVNEIDPLGWILGKDAVVPLGTKCESSDQLSWVSSLACEIPARALECTSDRWSVRGWPDRRCPTIPCQWQWRCRMQGQPILSIRLLNLLLFYTLSKKVQKLRLGLYTFKRYTLGSNMHPLGVNKIQKCSFWKCTAPVTFFVPFFLRE